LTSTRSIFIHLRLVASNLAHLRLFQQTLLSGKSNREKRDESAKDAMISDDFKIKLINLKALY